MNKHNVIVYSTPTCPYCVMAKKYLTDKGQEFKDVDVSQDMASAREMVEKSGQMGVPVIDIDGELTVGFDKERISKLLNIK